MTALPRLSRSLLAVLALAVAGAGSYSIAHAATPAEGTISLAAPKVEWAGELTSSGLTMIAWENGYTDTPCQTPTCDPFTLTVADTAPGVNLVIKMRIQGVALQGNNGDGGIRLTKPDGTSEVYIGESGPDVDLKVTVKNAPAGVYQIDTVASYVCCSTTEYITTAALEGPGVAGAPAAAPAPAPGAGPTPPPSAQPQAATLTVKARTVSARKARRSRKIAATLTASAPLRNVTVVLASGKRKLGSLKLASLQGRKKVTLKLSRKAKLKRGGKYQLSAGGTDAQGRSVVGSTRLKVKK